MGISHPLLSSSNTLSASSESDFMKQLTYIESTSTPQLGSIEIYRFNEAPYDYLMKNRRVFRNDDPSLENYLHNLSIVIEKLNHKNIVQIHYYKTTARIFCI